MSPHTQFALSAREFAHLGMSDIAYVKRVVVDNEPVYELHAADGTPIGVVRDRETAFAALRQHDLEPVSVH